MAGMKVVVVKKDPGVTEADIRAFQKVLNNAGLVAPLRRTRGDDIDAACGQLKSETEKLSARERQALRAIL